MLLAHRFDSAAALNRAHFWLNHHGFHVQPGHRADAGKPQLTVCVPMSQVPAALALIDSIERADHEGHPGLPPALTRVAEFIDLKTVPAGTPIHFVIAEGLTPVGEPEVDAVRKCMDHYHE